jgi:hypothetical protein
LKIENDHGFPLQPIDGHTLIASWRFSLEPIFFLPSDKMADRHLLHNTPKIQSIGVYTINQLTGLWICVLGRSSCARVWEDNDMKTMKEFLTWYNNKDAEPMLEASDKMFQFNQNRYT